MKQREKRIPTECKSKLIQKARKLSHLVNKNSEQQINKKKSVCKLHHFIEKLLAKRFDITTNLTGR